MTAHQRPKYIYIYIYIYKSVISSRKCKPRKRWAGTKGLTKDWKGSILKIMPKSCLLPLNNWNGKAKIQLLKHRCRRAVGSPAFFNHRSRQSRAKSGACLKNLFHIPCTLSGVNRHVFEVVHQLVSSNIHLNASDMKQLTRWMSTFCE